jgi:DNA-binding CsgD family transcriptional regulator
LFSQFGAQSNAEWFCDVVAINHQVEQWMAGASAEYFRQNPTIKYYLETQCSDAVKNSDFLSESEFHRCTALYDEFLYPVGQQDQMAIVLIHPGELALVNKFQSSEFIYSPHVMLNFEPSRQESIGLNSGLVLLLHRPERSFQERDRAILNLLRPHFLQAYQNSLIFSNLQQHRQNHAPQGRQLSQITLSPEGEMLWCTDSAERLLHKYFLKGLNSPTQLPEVLQGWINAQIANLQSALTVPALPFQIKLHAYQLDVRLLVDTMTGQYLLILDEKIGVDISTTVLQKLGLTRREAEVMSLIITKKTDRQIAEQLTINLRTVQKHSENIYRKLAVDHRTAAMIKVINLLGITEI